MYMYVEPRLQRKYTRVLIGAFLWFENRHAPWCIAIGCCGHRWSGNAWLVRIVREETRRVLNGGII